MLNTWHSLVYSEAHFVFVCWSNRLFQHHGRVYPIVLTADWDREQQKDHYQPREDPGGLQGHSARELHSCSQNQGGLITLETHHSALWGGCQTEQWDCCDGVCHGVTQPLEETRGERERREAFTICTYQPPFINLIASPVQAHTAHTLGCFWPRCVHEGDVSFFFFVLVELFFFCLFILRAQTWGNIMLAIWMRCPDGYDIKWQIWQGQLLH